MRIAFISSTVAVVALTACSGGGSGSSPVTIPSSAPQAPSSSQAMTESAVATTNALGTPLKDFAAYTSTVGPIALTASRSTLVAGDGACHSGFEFFAPDKNGDPNSTEVQSFYDAGCSQLARDVVRVFTSTGSTSESIVRTEKLYAANNTSPIAERDGNEAIANATFDAHGFPIVANGFTRIDRGSLAISGAQTISSAHELVMAPASNGSNTFCGDSAGFNVTGFAKLGETFGWQGQLANGSRVSNADGTVTWSSTHTGNGVKGPIGSLAIVTGTANTACPIGTPDFTISGGTTLGTYTIPIAATYRAGTLQSLTISNATLANGDTLNVATSTTVPPSSSLFVFGTIANAGAPVASFATDAFGSGTLTLASGAQFVIVDWHVVR